MPESACRWVLGSEQTAMSFPGKSGKDGVFRSSTRCAVNATSSVCFGTLLLLILGPALLNRESVRVLGGGSPSGLATLEHVLLVPLAEAGVLLAIVGGTLSKNRRERNLAAAVTGLLGVFVVLRMAQLI
jgi:hypothetical protein